MHHVWTDEQSTVIEDPSAFVWVDAGPGTGKTTTLAGRASLIIERGIEDPDDVVLFTYTRSMAADLRVRVAALMPDDLGCHECAGSGSVESFTCGACMGTGKSVVGKIQIGTLHGTAAALCGRALRGEIPGRGELEDLGWLNGETFGVVDDQDLDAVVRIAKKIVGRKPTVKALREGLALAGGQLLANPPEAEARRQLRARSLVTYDDLLTMLLAIAPYLGEVYPCVMLDERQDLGALHWKILSTWDPERLTVVGDDAQSIFGFLNRGAEPVPIPEWEWSRHTLTMNFRSAAAITIHANQVRDALAKDGACDPLAQEWAMSGGSVTRCVGATDGAFAVCDAIDASAQLTDVAVLAPTWALVDDIAHELDSLGIVVDVPMTAGAWKGIGGRAAVALARSAVRGAFDEMDLEAIFLALGAPDGTQGEVIEHAYQHETSYALALDEVYPVSAPAPPGLGWWSEVLGVGKQLTELAALIDASPSLLDGESTASRLLEWARSGRDETEAFLVWLASPEAAQERRNASGVRVQTIHAAKGQEWPVVALYGACEGAIPPAWAKAESAALEWGRALYVAITRPAERLIVITPRILRGVEREPTRWLPKGEET